jgi:hypothetical protein
MTTRKTSEELDEAGFAPEDPDAPRLWEPTGNLKKLLDRTAKPSVGWVPKAGDQLYGTVVDVQEAESEFGEYPLITVETPAGDCLDAHCFHTVLKRATERLIARGDLRPGSDIAITYFGQEAGRNGRDGAHMYRLAVDNEGD